MSMQCPRCGSHHVTARQVGRKFGAATGSGCGTAIGAAGALSGAKAGALIGLAAGPMVMTVTSLAGAVFGGLVGVQLSGWPVPSWAPSLIRKCWITLPALTANTPFARQSSKPVTTAV